MALCSLPCEKQLPRHSAAWTSPLRPLPCSHLRQQGLQAVGDGQLVQHGGPAGTEAQQASLQGVQARGSLYLQRSLPGRSGIRMGHWASKGAAAPPLAHKQQHGKQGQACATLCSVQTEQVHAAFETQMQGAAAAHLMISGSVTLFHRLPKASLWSGRAGRISSACHTPQHRAMQRSHLPRHSGTSDSGQIDCAPCQATVGSPA